MKKVVYLGALETLPDEDGVGGCVEVLINDETEEVFPSEKEAFDDLSGGCCMRPGQLLHILKAEVVQSHVQVQELRKVK